VIPFAATSKDDPWRRVVRLEWAGAALSAQATDGHHFGSSTWHPDDQVPEENNPDIDQATAFNPRGGDDPPWACVIDLDDAKALVADYKLPPKHGLTPLSVGGHWIAVTVARSRDTGWSAKTTTVQGLPLETQEHFPNLGKILAGHSARPAGKVAVNADRLAHFAKVRPVGPVELALSGDDGLILVTIGARFVGGIFPLKISVDVAGYRHTEPAVAGDLLKHGDVTGPSGDGIDPIEEPGEPVTERVRDEWLGDDQGGGR
jgi:hypothetical protein